MQPYFIAKRSLKKIVVFNKCMLNLSHSKKICIMDDPFIICHLKVHFLSKTAQ